MQTPMQARIPHPHSKMGNARRRTKAMATKYRHTHGDFLIEHSMPKPAVHGKMRVKLAPVFDVMPLPQASQQQQQHLQENWFSQ